MIPVLVLALAAQTPWGRIDPPPGLECVSKGSDALVLEAEELLAVPHIRELHLSPTGRFAFFTSTSQPDSDPWGTTTKIQFYDVARKAVRQVPAFNGQRYQDAEVLWSTDTAALILAETREDGYDLLAAYPTGSIEVIGEGSREEWGEIVDLHVSPSGDAILLGQSLTTTDGGQVEAKFIFRHLQNFKLSDPSVFNRETSGPKHVEWSHDGRFLRLRVDRGDPVRGGVRREMANYDLAGKTLSYEMAGPEPEAGPAPDFALVPRQPTVEANRWTHNVRTLWLEANHPSDEPSAFVCAEPSAWALSPRLDYILYTSKGALWMKTLRKMRVAEVRELQIKTIQDRAVSQAQRMGRAVVLYWRDNGQSYPKKRDFHSAIRTYNEDDEAIGRFVATFEGGPLRLGTNTETTPIGYIDAKIGRAYVMLDGHVRWEFNPKSG